MNSNQATCFVRCMSQRSGASRGAPEQMLCHPG
jgi:hypothetical protein